MFKSLVIAAFFFAVVVVAQSFTQVDCATFCNTTITACGAIGSGYYSRAGCLGWCSLLVASNLIGDISNVTGNTMGCRMYHAGVAAMNATMAAIHCPHAGPLGGGVCIDEPDSAGFDAYCIGAAASCPGAYPSVTVCSQSLYGASQSAMDPSVGANYSASGNNAACRATHLGAVIDGGNSAASRATHCPHASILGGNTCGNITEAASVFCSLASIVCTQEWSTFPYANVSACVAAAIAFPDNRIVESSYGTVNAIGNSISCRLAQLALTGCTDAIGPGSVNCTTLPSTTAPATAAPTSTTDAASQLSVALFALMVALALSIF